MPTDTIATQIADMIENNWSLPGDLLAASVIFREGWYDAEKSEYPQITVSHLDPHTDIEYFSEDLLHAGLRFIAREIYAVNCWLRIRGGDDGASEEPLMEDMREEVVRILTTQWSSFAPPLGAVRPRDRGTRMHTLQKVPRMLRTQILVQANTRE